MRRVQTYTNYKRDTIEYEGVFHGFGLEYEEYDNGIGNYTVAIIELPDGEIRTTPVYLIKFLDKGE